MSTVHCPVPIRQLWLYRRVSATLWQVGFFDPTGTWHSDSDHNSSAAAADRVHWLHGSPAPNQSATSDRELAALRTQLRISDQQARKWRSLAIRRARKARERRRASR